jgi:hypothetical protein
MSAKRVDANQADIVKALRWAGASVTDTHIVGHGFVDITVGFRLVNYLLEVKIGPDEPLTPDELRWHANWAGQKAIIWSPEQALAAIGLYAAPIDRFARNTGQTGR